MLNKFRYRSSQQEWMDQPGVSKELLFRNLRELDILNRFMGGHAISIKGIKKLALTSEKPLHIVDLGCGSGDVLMYMARWARHTNMKAKFTGVDLNAHAIAYLKKKSAGYPEIEAVHSGYLDFVQSNRPVDIYHCSLFCHHLTDQQLIELFRLFGSNASLGFIINDLMRSPLAYYSSVVFTRLANATPLAKNDGPVSVLRGFKKNELVSLLNSSGIHDFRISAEFGFRYLITGRSKNTIT